MGPHHDPDDLDHQDLDDDLGRPVYHGDGLSVRELSAAELQRFLDAHTGQPAQLLGSGWAALNPPGHPHGVPRTPPAGTAAAPAEPVTGSHGRPGRSALVEYRRRRALERAAWTHSLAWRAPLIGAAAITAAVVAARAGLPRGGLAGPAVAVLVGWRLRFRPSEHARTWRRGAAGERHTARLLDRLTRDGYVVFHDLAVPGSDANLDHLVIGNSGVFVIDTKQWTGQVYQGADGLVWHNHYRLDHTLATVRWEAEKVGRLLSTRAAALLSTAPTSKAAAWTPRAWPSSPLSCSAARSAMTQCCRAPRWSCSPPPRGGRFVRPPSVPNRPAGGGPARRSDSGVDGLPRVAQRPWLTRGSWGPVGRPARC